MPLLPDSDLGVIHSSPAPLSWTLSTIRWRVVVASDEPRQRVTLLSLDRLPTMLIRPPTSVTSGDMMTVAFLTSSVGSRQYRSPLLLAGTSMNALPFVRRRWTTVLRLFPNRAKLKQRCNAEHTPQAKDARNQKAQASSAALCSQMAPREPSSSTTNSNGKSGSSS